MLDGASHELNLENLFKETRRCLAQRPSSSFITKSSYLKSSCSSPLKCRLKNTLTEYFPAMTAKSTNYFQAPGLGPVFSAASGLWVDLTLVSVSHEVIYLLTSISISWPDTLSRW